MSNGIPAPEVFGAVVPGINYPSGAPHLGHAKHLCYMASGGADLDNYKALVKDAKFICKTCGRAAAKAVNLCDPTPL